MREKLSEALELWLKEATEERWASYGSCPEHRFLLVAWPRLAAWLFCWKEGNSLENKTYIQADSVNLRM